MRYLLVLLLIFTNSFGQGRRDNGKIKFFTRSYLAELKKNDPEEFTRLNILKEKDKEKFHQQIRIKFADKIFHNSVEAIDRPKNKKLPPHITRYFENLKTTDSEEYDRLNKILQTDPREFKRQIFQKLNKGKKERGYNFKNFLPYLKKLNESDPERYKYLKDLFITDPKKFRQEATKIFLEKQQSDITDRQKVMKKLKKQADVYMNLPEGIEKSNAYEQLRSSVTLNVDSRLQVKREVLENLKKKLSKLEKHVHAVEMHRTKIIEQKLLKLLNQLKNDEKDN